MSALTIWAGLESIFRSVEGVSLVILGDPPTIQESPAIIVAYLGFDHPLKNNPPARNLYGFQHRFAVRLAIDWQDNPNAEMQLLTLIDAIPLAVDADPHLSQALSSGVASISDAVTGYAEYSRKKYRIADYTATILEKRIGT